MTISLGGFLSALSGNPPLQITTVLILGVILVNGWTDAPNAIASLVASGGMELRKAVRMAAVFNFIGLAAMTSWNANVAFTIFHIADFGDSPQKALTGLCAALTAIIAWSALAWCFGIPTSESHALIAGLTGAAVSIHHSFQGVNIQEWVKVLYGLLFSSFLGGWLGWSGGKCLAGIEKKGLLGAEGKRNIVWKGTLAQGGKVCGWKNKKSIEAKIGQNRESLTGWKRRSKKKEKQGKKWKRRIGQMQIAGAAAMAFMHGAQDGQKFIGVFLMGIFLAQGERSGNGFLIPLWMTGLCSIVMAAGTSIGGERIIKTVGTDMVKLGRPQSVVSDAAAAVCLFFSSMIGVPVSTTHVKTTAIMGVGMASGMESVDMSIVGEMVLAWIITFPCCGAIGYMAAEIFQRLA